MTAGERREDEVIASFIELLSNYFSEVTLEERPDRIRENERRYPNLTTDSLLKLKIKGQYIWLGVDVMVMAASRENLAYNDATDALDVIAKTNGLRITLIATNPIFRSEVVPLKDALEVELVKYPISGNLHLREGVDLAWEVPPSPHEVEFSLIGMSHSPSANLAEQICSENITPLKRKTKVGGQAERTKSYGLPYILICDGVGQEDVIQGMHFLAQFPITYKTGILQALGEREQLIDGLYFLSNRNIWSLFKNNIAGFETLSKDLEV